VKKVKVLIVDDSAFMRKLIADFLQSDERIEVIGIARNGQDAVTKVRQLQPDVVTMDVEMPVMNGLEALKTIMSETPVPVVMLSSTTKEGAENTIISMQYGAVDFIAKPSGAISLDLYKVKQDLIEKVVLASQVNITVLKPSIAEWKIVNSQEKNAHEVESNPNSKLYKLSTKKKIIGIGTSTGGPRALQQVLSHLPKSINAPIFVVQHMPPGFTKSLAERLDSICEIRVKEAEDGEIVQKGTAYIAPGGFHLKVKKVGTALALKVDQSTVRNGHRPSVDVMFESLSKLKEYKKIAVIMTGMGSDGTEGLKALKASGDTKAIAESEKTSIVYGMPRSAIATNLIDEVVDLEGIAPAILHYL
jgi:two-component system, chemotaxis family, protein-glutamate methylesterase/glutaminase